MIFHPVQMRLSGFYIAIFLAVGTHMPYWPVWLSAQGMDAGAVASLITVGLMMRLVSGPVIGALVDRVGERRRPMIGLAVMALLCFASFTLADGYYGLLIVTILTMTFMPAMMPLIETLAVSTARRQGFDYGRIRLWGSLSFIVANLAGGVMLAQWGAHAILPTILFGLGLTIAAALMLPKDPGTDRSLQRGVKKTGVGVQRTVGDDAGPVPVSMPEPKRKGSLRVIAASPRFWLFAGSAALIQSSHALYYALGSIHFQAQGIDGELIGMLWAVGVIAEVLLFTVSSRMVGLFTPMGLLLIGGGAGGLRWGVMAFDPGLGILFVAQTLHALTFAATHLGTIHMIDRAVPEAYAVTAQSTFFTLSGGIGLGLVTILAGQLYEAHGGAAYGAMAATAALGAAGILTLSRVGTAGGLVKGPDDYALSPEPKPGQSVS